MTANQRREWIFKFIDTYKILFLFPEKIKWIKIDKKRPRELNSKKSRKIPRELNSVLNRESENIAPEGVKKENKPFRVKNQFFFYLDGNWKCQKETKFFKWSRPKKLNSVRLLPRKYTVYSTPLNGARPLASRIFFYWKVGHETS